MSHGFIPVPNVASVELIYSLNGIVAENQFHVHKGSPYSASDLTALRTTVDTWDSSTGKGLRAVACTLVRIRSKSLESAGAPMEDFALATPRAGTQAGTVYPANVSFAYKKSTGLSGRSFRGRWYHVGLTTGAVGTTPNQLASVSVTNFLGFLNALQTALTSAGHTMGVVSYRTGGAYRTTGVFTAQTGFVAVDLNIDSMRKRLTGRGST